MVMLEVNDVHMAVPPYIVREIVLVASGKLEEKGFRRKMYSWCSGSRIHAFFKGIKYETWPNLQLQFLITLGYRLGYPPGLKRIRERQLDWYAAGSEDILRKTMNEYEAFSKQGYPKPFDIDFKDEDFTEE
jgi:hypothetical protein